MLHRTPCDEALPATFTQTPTANASPESALRSSAQSDGVSLGGVAQRAWGKLRMSACGAHVAVRETGLMWANKLRAFQVGKALTSDETPSSWMRFSRVAWAQVSWPACHFTKASASAVM